MSPVSLVFHLIGSHAEHSLVRAMVTLLFTQIVFFEKKNPWWFGAESWTYHVE